MDGAEALLMFQKLVLVFYQITTRYIFILSLICWGMLQNSINFILYIIFTSVVTPRVPVIIPLAMDRNLLVKHDTRYAKCMVVHVHVTLSFQ